MDANPIIELWNMFMIVAMLFVIIILLGIVVWVLGLSLYEFCIAHVYLFTKCCNKCFFCCIKPINTSTIVPITKCDLVYIVKTPSGHNNYDAEPIDIRSIKIVL